MKARTTKPKKAPKETEGRKKSLLTQAGDRAKWETERALLLKTLKANGWNLTHTSNVLQMGQPSAVLTAISKYELRDEYDKAREKK